MAFLEGKPLHVRKRIAIIATGCVAAILIGVMIYIYTRPQHERNSPDEVIVSAYTTILGKIQSPFGSK